MADRAGSRRSAASRGVRVVLAAVLGMAGLVTVAAPAGAALGTLQSGVTWSVAASVGPTTPLWTLDVTFTFTGGTITCPAELHYTIAATAQKATVCGSGGTAPASVRVRRPVFGSSGSGITTLNPSSTAQVKAEVRTTDTGLNNNPGGTTKSISVPPPPIWVGVGDGYTSSVRQTTDTDTTATSYDADDEALSWIQAATSRLNGLYQVPSTWAVTPHVIADDEATATGLASTVVPALGKTQAARMTELLSERRGSWNWVGFTAGLVDVGIPGVLADWYANSYPYATSNVKPWDASVLAECPDLTPAVNNLANGTLVANVKSSLSSLVNAAKTADGSVRLIQLLYPYLTDRDNNTVNGETSYRNPCADGGTGRPGNRTVVNDLNTAIGLGTVQNLYVLDLRSGSGGFGETPTGSRVWQDGTCPPLDRTCVPVSGVVRSGSFLQLTRPYGYPYPAAIGSSQAGTGAVDIAVNQAASDTEPPAVVGVPARGADRNGWYNKPVDILWTGSDRPDPGGKGINKVGGQTLASPVPSATASSGATLPGAVRNRYISPVFCDVDDNCATGFVDLSTDFRKPEVTATPHKPANQHGWWNEDVTVTWRFTGRDDSGATDVSGPDKTTQQAQKTEVTTTISKTRVQNFAGTMCDVAGNCSTAYVDVNIDKLAPTVSPSVSTASGAAPRLGKWYREPVTVTWTVTDQDNGSGPLPLSPSQVTTDGDDIPVTVDGFDKAGNKTRQTVKVSIDRVAPAVTLGGPVQGGQYTGVAPDPVCTATDALSGVDTSGLTGTCSVDLKVVQRHRDANGRVTKIDYELRASALDKAGNRTDKGPVTFSVVDPVNSEPPKVDWRIVRDGAVLVDPAAGTADFDKNDWFNQDVEVDWIVSDPDSGETLPDVPNTPVTTDGVHAVPSPQVCDSNNNCLAAGHVTVPVKLDKTRPTVSLSGGVNGKTYVKAEEPVPEAVCGDALSGVDPLTCAVEKVAETSLEDDDPNGPPGRRLTYRASVEDNAGNSQTSTELTFTVIDIEPSGDGEGRMTGSAEVGGLHASFTLRCNGAPNPLGVTWTGGSFTLTHFETYDVGGVAKPRFFCWQGSWDHQQPAAPINGVWIHGRGVLLDGTPATIFITLKDKGEPGKDTDTMSVRIVRDDGSVVKQASGAHSGGGNVQAHYAQGDGTNDDGDVDVPNSGKK